ncbi:arsinothricin resistance N-acetyltransferase ArsN1 family A [Geosporobacter ferrireducens]|uniref:arsinothricin resistance N-acetyltransferase ArsN1 family A n=1 Tax=Geosporobacter ferrireducens TaxID=1424294 RepID=UPI00139F0B82|nr:arsinothricin resistance N-acetyltransferase ArsN1 family A [Geosporobacter ferrireducens]MTI55456.1 N-acetyltransferase family protein [Geosporobacter ferrireducens]
MYSTRVATVQDVVAITKIYNEGIEDRIATLETRLRDSIEMEAWLSNRSEAHKVLVIVDDSNQVLGWASLNVFNGRCCYSGVVDLSIYIGRSVRGKGLGKILLQSLIDTARVQGFHKLVLSTFKFNEGGQKLYQAMGFREVGTYMQHGILDGKWIDVTVMEKLLF